MSIEISSLINDPDLLTIITNNNLTENTIFDLSDSDVLLMLNNNFGLKAKFNSLKNNLMLRKEETHINEQNNSNLPCTSGIVTESIEVNEIYGKKQSWPVIFTFPTNKVSYSLNTLLSETTKDIDENYLLTGIVDLLHHKIINEIKQ